MESKVVTEDGMNVLIEQIEAPSADAIKQIAYDFRNKFDDLVLVLAASIDGKPSLNIMLSDSIISGKGWDAGKMVRELAKNIKGGGGGQPFFATAGGKDLSGLPIVVEKAKEFIKK